MVTSLEAAYVYVYILNSLSDIEWNVEMYELIILNEAEKLKKELG